MILISHDGVVAAGNSRIRRKTSVFAFRLSNILGCGMPLAVRVRRCYPGVTVTHESFVSLIALVDPRLEYLKLLQAALDLLFGLCQSQAIFGLPCIRVLVKVVDDKLGMSVQEQIGLLIIAFVLVYLGLQFRMIRLIPGTKKRCPGITPL